MDEYAFQSATELTKAIRDREISSAELLEMYIERYERLNPQLNAIVATNFDDARIRAREADQALADGENWGPLHGLPMTIKDCIEVTGMPCTWGHPPLKNHMPTRNAVVVQPLIDAGAVIFGKTNLPMFANDYHSHNEVYGQTNNPWDLSRSPGGSSGGAAAALAAGLTGLEIGSDIGGSIRSPCHYSGIYGHKPSHGIVSTLGQSPPPASPGDYSTEPDLLVTGPMARSADDLDLAMGLVAKPPLYQRNAISIQLPQPRQKSLKDYRIGLWLDDPAYPVDSAVGDCLQAAADRLAAAGMQVSEDRPDIDLSDCHRTYMSLLNLAMVSMVVTGPAMEKMKKALATLQDDDESDMAAYIRLMTSTHREWQQLNYQRTMMRQKWADYFTEIDVLLCPVTRVPAFSHDLTPIPQRVLSVNDREERCQDALLPWVGLTGVSYLPATVAPVGLTPEGLPIGVQIVGPYLEDRTPIHVAGLMADVTGGFTRPPGY
jgi:amidase